MKTKALFLSVLLFAGLASAWSASPAADPIPVIMLTECGELTQTALYWVKADLKNLNGDCLIVKPEANGSTVFCSEPKMITGGYDVGSGVLIQADDIAVRGCWFQDFKNSVKAEGVKRPVIEHNAFFQFGNPFQNGFLALNVEYAQVRDNWAPFSDLRVINSYGWALNGHYQRAWLSNSPFFYLIDVSYLELIID